MSDHVTERPPDTRMTAQPTSAPPVPGPRAITPRLLGWGAAAVVLWAFLTLVGCLPRWETDGPVDPDLVRPVDLAELFAQAAAHDPQAGPWPAEARDDPLQATVEQLLDNVRHGTGKHTLGLPVRFGDAPVTSAARIDLGHASGAILLGREHVRVSHLSDSLVICPGAVEVSHSNRNVIIAGHYLDVGFDGMTTFGGLVGAPARSLLVCGRKLRVGHARDTITLAPDVTAAHANRVLFLHRRQGHLSHPWWCRDEHPAGLLSPRAQAADPLAEKVDLRRVFEDQQAVLFARDRATGVEVRLEQGDGHEGGPLAGWRVVAATPHAALLHDGKRRSLLALTREQETAPTFPHRGPPKAR